MKKKALTYRQIFLLLLFIGCRDPYEPSISDNGPGFLVAEGFINAGKHPTTIILSRVNGFGERDFKPEADAIVLVEGEDNQVQSLTYTGNGRYSGELLIDKNQKYRIRIKTSADNKEYLSDFVEVIVAPDIAAITWEPMETGVQIQVSVHDNPNSSGYYRWEYEETWAFRVPVWTELIYRNGWFQQRTPEELFPLVCYRHSPGDKILLHSTAHQDENVFNRHPLLEIDNKTERLQFKYSILVRQYVLEPKAFQFWQNIAKNSESMGSVFDPQPIQLESNIRCLNDPDEMVVGFINAGEYKEKRIFISRHNIDSDFTIHSEFDSCTITELDNLSGLDFVLENEVIVPVEIKNGFIYTTTRECADCSISGSPEAPDFWE